MVVGEGQKTAFFAMLRDNPSSSSQTIKKNNLPLLRVGKHKTQEIKAQLNLFSELYVATQVRGGDMDELFCHESSHILHPSQLLAVYALVRNLECYPT